MASLKLRGNVYHFQTRADRSWRSTGIKVSVYGPKVAEKKALLYAHDREEKELARESDTVSLSDLLQLVDTLPKIDKTQLAISLVDFLPEGLRQTENTCSNTFSEIRNEFVGYFEDGSSNNWKDREKRSNDAFIEYITSKGISLISEIRPKDINNFIRILKKDKAPATVLTYLAPISQVFEYAITNELIRSNPVSKVDKSKLNKNLEENRHIAIPSAALDNVFAKADQDDEIFWTWLRYTGLNGVDVSSLTPSAIQNNDKGHYIDGKRTKSKNPIRIPIHEKIELLEQKYGKRIYGVYPKKTDRDQSNKRFKSLLKKEGYDTPLASLRHTFITNLFNAGYEPSQIIKIVGHSSTKLLERVYVTDVEAKLAQEAVNKVQ
jgi:integrase